MESNGMNQTNQICHFCSSSFIQCIIFFLRSNYNQSTRQMGLYKVNIFFNCRKDKAMGRSATCKRPGGGLIHRTDRNTEFMPPLHVHLILFYIINHIHMPLSSLLPHQDSVQGPWYVHVLPCFISANLHSWLPTHTFCFSLTKTQPWWAMMNCVWSKSQREGTRKRGEQEDYIDNKTEIVSCCYSMNALQLALIYLQGNSNYWNMTTSLSYLSKTEGREHLDKEKYELVWTIMKKEKQSYKNLSMMI